MFLGLVLTSFVVWHKDRSFARAGTAPSVLIPNITTLQLATAPAKGVGIHTELA
jgi:hypothetical protein